jgi:glycosyltransferase involved in cell wall biosynthesis
VDGVKWVRYERFNPRDIFNIIISWRNNSFLDPVVASKKFIDMHDVPDLEFFPEDSIRDVTIMVKSDYHRSLFPDIPDERFMIVPNGVDLTQFKNPKKVKNSLVWTSSYDRGLEYLLEMWPQIQAEVPDATIDVAYGFQLYDQSPWGRNRKGQQWKARMLKLLDQKGVRHRGRLSSTEVATLYNAADVFAYPSGFPEIDMISLTKAMAAKCVPIATQTGAVKERNQGVVVDGDINDPDTRQRFTQELIALLKDEKRKKEIRSKLDVNKYSWDEVAKQWDGLFHG